MITNELEIFQRLSLVEVLIIADKKDILTKTIQEYLDSSINLSEIEYYKSALFFYNFGEIDMALNAIRNYKSKIIPKILKYQCPKTWESLSGSVLDSVKFCDFCKQKVYKVTTREEYELRKKLSQCVAISFENHLLNENTLGCEMYAKDQVYFKLMGTVE